MEISNLKNFDNHEAVYFFSDKESGLTSFVAIHSTNLGPATGGTRFFGYKNETLALEDALRLSRAMTFKCALAGVPFGGGKGVIVASRKVRRRSDLFSSYAARINLLRGSFTTGEDIGITGSDLRIMQKRSKFINGRKNKAGALGPWAALGIYSAARAAAKSAFGSRSLAGKIVAVKGLGKVGLNLCALLFQNGAAVIAADIDNSAVSAAKKIFPKLLIVEPSQIHRQNADIFSPCALSGDINERSIHELKCRIICGGANNQLTHPDIAHELQRMGIVYVPDYVANAGGLINVAGELRGEYDRDWVSQKVLKIGKTAEKILSISQKSGKPPDYVAENLARRIIKTGKFLI